MILINESNTTKQSNSLTTLERHVDFLLQRLRLVQQVAGMLQGAHRILDLADALDRDRPARDLDLIGVERLGHHRGADVARVHRVDSDALVGVAERRGNARIRDRHDDVGGDAALARRLLHHPWQAHQPQTAKAQAKTQ